ncbi:hypothetical protein B7435_16700 [Mycolicibacterium peregrinum]|uniref:Uncharacterized protein n=1 Tax=Mycolicibacterium fortuitum TaxID=1766 RepID=A0A378UAM1_MYCFO|nr:hypothetical protein B7435_16700 [Mycolicibacterium peregrinum]STZ73719.1 Uncharacterised protein [Mycolicibacterium fortuitum]
MIYHDKVHVTMEVPFDPPQYNDYGNEIYDLVDQDVPAEVFPLGTDAVINMNTEKVVSRYRMVLQPVIDIPANVGDGLRLDWGPYSGMFVDGTVERHYVRGRLRHYELITKAVVGG